MVIQCPSCQTRFRIADDKVGPNGVQVRCSKCSSTFPVRREDGEPTGKIKAVEAEPTTNVTKVDPPQPPPSADRTALTQVSVDKTAVTPISVAGIPSPFAPAFAPTPAESAPSLVRPPSRPELSKERLDGSGASNAEPAAPPPGFGAGLGSSGLPLGIPDPFAAIADGAAPPGGPANGANPFADGGDDASPALDDNVRSSLLSQTGSLSDEDDAIPDLAAPRAAPAAAARAAASVARPAPPPEERLSLDSENEPIPRGPRPDDLRAKRAKRKPTIGMKLQAAADVAGEPRAIYRALLGVFFVGALTAAFASLTDGTFDPSRLDRARLSIVLGPPKVDPAVAGLAITADAGRYVETAPGKPRVFVARGVAVNAGSAVRGFLEVRGRLRNAEGNILAETRVPCGNSFRDDQLRSLASADELNRFYVPLGDGGANAKVDPGVAEPCVVVFYDAPPPEKVAGYDLEIVAAQASSG